MDGNGAVLSRSATIDVARGLAIVGMIAANMSRAIVTAFPAGETYATLLHARWEGCTLADLVFPLFLFLMGISIALSMGSATVVPWKRVLRRAAVLVVLGIGVNATNAALRGAPLLVPDGTLQRIGLVYLISVPIFVRLSPRARLVLCGAVLGFYAVALEWLPFPGLGPSDLSVPHRNVAAWVDLRVFGEALARPGPDGVPTSAQGLLALATSSVITIAGTLAGERFRQAQRSEGSVVPRLVVSGLVLSLIGLSWGTVHPISRPLWSSPYVLLTVGLSLLTVAAIHLLLTGRGGAIRVTRPLETFGRNALAAYLIHVPAIILATATLRGLYAALEPILGAPSAALVVVALVLGFVYLPIRVMRRRDIAWRL